MTNFFIQCYLSYRALFFWLNWPVYLDNVFVVPVLYITMLMLTGGFADRDHTGFTPFYESGPTLSPPNRKIRSRTVRISERSGRTWLGRHFAKSSAE